MFTNRKQNTLRKAKAGLVSFGALAIGLVANAGIVSAEAYTSETWKATTVQEMKQEIGNAVENGGTVKAQWGWTISVLSEATGISEENLLKIASNFESKSLIFSEQTHGQGATIFEFSKKEAVVVSNENTTLATDGYVTETQQQVTVTQPSGEQATVVIKTDTKGEQTIVNTPIDNGVSEAVVAFDKNDMKPTDETAPAVKPTVKPVETKPVKPVETAPVKPVETAPVKPVEIKPVKPVETAPVKPVETDPVKPKTVEHRETKELNFETETRQTNELFKDEKRVVRKGVKGSQVVITKVTTLNDKEINREVINGERVEPISEIIEVGTKERDVSQSKTVEHRETKELDFETETKYRDDLFTDERYIIRKGVKGSQVVITKVTTLNGKEINREVVNGERVEPISEIRWIGTKERGIALGSPEFLKLMDEKFSQEKLNAKFLELVNAERSKLGLHTLKQSTQAAKAAKLRAKEQVEHGDLRSFGKAHIRPNNESFGSIQKEVPATPGYYYMTENLTGATLSQLMNIEDEEAVAQYMFTSWKNSPGHYASMMHSRAQLVGVGVQHTPGLLGGGFYGAMLIETELK